MLALVLVALGAVPERSMGEKLQAVAAAKVFVAHQSVGQNVLDGASALAFQHAVTLHLDHAPSGKEGAPIAKLAGFGKLLEGAGAQVAVLELSYADFTADTDVEALFAELQKRLEEWRARFPGTRVLVMTVPLSTVQRGLQGALRNRVTKGAFGERENVKRHLFNGLLRKQVAPLFDLAAVEAGSCTFEREGKSWPCLREEFTDDGVHLNALGRKEAGKAFVEAVAAAL